MKERMLINHCHVGAVEFGGSNDPEIGTLPKLKQILEAAGVDYAVVFAPFPKEGLGWSGDAVNRFKDPNEWLAKELKQYADFFGFACINPKEPDAPGRLVRAVKLGLLGAKVHPPVHGITLNDLAIDGFFQAAEELGIPVDIHTGVHGGFLRTYQPILIDDVAQRHPNLPIIVEHIGGYAFFDQALAVLQNNKNCYVGLTGTSPHVDNPIYYLPPERTNILVKTVGADRIIYGLDYPWNSDNLAALRTDIEWIQSWDMPNQDKEEILGGNLSRLINI